MHKFNCGRITSVLVKPVSEPVATLTPCDGFNDMDLHDHKKSLDQTEIGQREHTFLNDFDVEALESLKTFNNRPSQLCKIAAPAVLSLALCPFLLYIYGPMVTLFWPNKTAQPNINEAIACFLAPAGLVYATSFGFAFQQVLTKQHDLLAKISYEIGLLDQILTLTSKLTLPTQEFRKSIYRSVKAEAMFMVLQIENREGSSFKHKPMENIKGKWIIFYVMSLLDRALFYRFR